MALSSSKVAPGGGLAISLYDLNMGNSAAGASMTAVNLSTEPTINSDDTLLTTRPLQRLAPIRRPAITITKTSR